MTLILVMTALFFAAVLVAVIFGIRAILKTRNRMQHAFADGMRRGAGEPGAENAVRGVGGLTAAQTTAMANNFLGTFGGRQANPPAGAQAHPESHPALDHSND